MPKVSDVYGPARPKFLPKPKPEQPQVQSLEAASMICKRGTELWLRHRWGPGFVCVRCGGLADIKGLLDLQK